MRGMQEKRMQALRVKYSSKIFLSILKSMLVIIPFPVILLIVVELVSLHAIQDTITDYEDGIYDQVAEDLKNSYESALLVMRDMRREENLLRYLRQDERNYYQEYELYQMMTQTLKRNRNLSELSVYFLEDEYVVSTSGSKESRAYHETFYSNSYEEWEKEQMERMDGQIVLKKDSEGTVVLRSSIGYESMKQAVVTVKFKGAYTKELLKKLCNNEQERAWFLYGAQMLASTQGGNDDALAKTLLESHLKQEDFVKLEGQKFSLKVREISRDGLFLVYGVPDGIKYFVVEMIKILAIISVVLCLVVLVGAIVLAANHNYTPIKRLFDILRQGDSTASEIDYDVMEGYAENFHKQKQQMQMKLKQYEDNVKNLYLGELLLTDTNRKISQEQVESWGFFGKYFVVVMYQFEENETEAEQEKKEEYRKDILEEYIKEYLKECVCCYLVERNSRVYCVLNGNGENDQIFSDAVRDRNGVLVENLTRVENLYCDAYMSGCFMSINEIHQGYFEVKQVKKKQVKKKQVMKECEDVSENNCSIEKVEEGIRENLLDVNLSVASLAEFLKITPSYLSRFFKRNTGKGVLEYIHECRIEKAKEIMLQNPDVKAKEVAEAVGFANLATFIRVFKKREGITPGQFREEMAGGMIESKNKGE